MPQALAVGLVILTLVAVSTLIANRFGTPAPVVQTGIGIVLGFVPVMPHVDLPPGFVMFAILPPLVYAAAVELPWEDFRDNLRPISALAIGLVAATIAAVAAAAHELIPGLSWAEAAVLGAIVSPTDPAASTAVASRLGVPRRLTAIIEGEGLVNDAVSLTIYRLALTALAAGAFAIGVGVLRFVLVVVGEIAYGCAVGWAVTQIRKRITDPRAEITVSLLTPFAAYLVPEALGGSGVLATLSAGMYIGEKTPEIVPSGTRLHLTGVWDIIIHLLNGALFLLTGLQFRSLWEGRTDFAPSSLLWYGILVSAVVIATRFAWIWPAAWASRAISGNLRERDPMPSAGHFAFLSWSGMRGGISLAAAFSIPLAVHARPLILFLTAAVIAATLLIQGVTLPFVIHALRLDREAKNEETDLRLEEASARSECIQAALHALDAHSGPAAELLRAEYRQSAARLQDAQDECKAHAQVRKSAIEAERRCLLQLHRDRKIAEEVMRRIERDVDLREALLTESLARID